MRHTLFLFDDQMARTWDPLVLTRPVGELLFGSLLFRDRAERYWGCACGGQLSEESLIGFSEPGSAPVLGYADLPSEGFRIVQSSRVAPAGAGPESLPDRLTTLFVDDQVVGWVLPPGHPGPGPIGLRNPTFLDGSRAMEIKGRIPGSPWELMAQNADQLRDDIPRFSPGYATDQLPGSHILGDGLLSIGSHARVEPGCVFDVSGGPIRLDDGVVVRAHTRLEGPAFIGPGSTVLGGSLSEVSMGPGCKVRGEVEATVILGYSSKAHDGFLGHGYLGRWVNLGAFTTNSDLKNNYGPVRVGGPGEPRDTGLVKVGCFLGDHVKTGIGTFLNTGTLVGAGSNIFGGRMPPTYVPAFSWGVGEELTEFRLDKCLEVAVRAMGRRGMELEAGMEAVLRRAWESTRALRRDGMDS